jgi:hypothetical protein
MDDGDYRRTSRARFRVTLRAILRQGEAGKRKRKRKWKRIGRQVLCGILLKLLWPTESIAV